VVWVGSRKDVSREEEEEGEDKGELLVHFGLIHCPGV
jgi:hypothetical protein